MTESAQQNPCPEKHEKVTSPKSIIDKHLTLIIIIFAAGSLLLKFFLLNGRFLYIDPDEGYYFLLARNLISGLGYTFNGLPNIQFPPLLPFLIALFYFILHDLQLSLVFITTISGTLLGVVIFVIAKEKFSSSMLLLCSFFGFFIYQLNAFFPTLVPYTEVLYRGSDILNLFLLFAALYFVLMLIKKNKSIYSVLSGGFFALSYLTRSEGFLMFGLTLVCLTFLIITSLVSVSYKRVLIFALAFVILIMPYVVYLKSTTGKWTLSGKIFVSQQHKKSILSVVESEDWSEFQNYHYSLNKTAMEMNDSFWGYYPGSRWSSEVRVKDLPKDLLAKLKLFYLVPKKLFTPWLIVFFVLGIYKGVDKIRKRRSIIDIFLLLFFLYSVVITALAYPVPRHHLFLVPVFCIYTVEGLMLFFLWFDRHLWAKIKIKKAIAAVLPVLFLLIVGNDYFRYSVKNYLLKPSFRQLREIESEISQYLKERQARIIMSVNPAIAVKAFSDWQVMPMIDYITIFQFARQKKVEYLILRAPDYKIIHIEDSYIPKPQEKIGFEIIDRRKSFDLFKIVKQNEPKYPDA
jgi:4-amino-4-deoxy-L-arabinose transferase-like glycosyltransferase